MATFSVPMYAYPNGDTYIIVEGFERPCELYLIEQNHGALKKEYFQSKSSDEAIGTLEIEIDNNGRIETAYPAKRVFFKDVIDNQLTTLHESVCQLTKLTTLDLSKNKLTTLPESIGNLVKLWWLDLSENPISSLPTSIRNCKNLIELNLSGNMLNNKEKIAIKGYLPNCNITGL